MRVTRPNLLSWYDASADLNALPSASLDCRTGALITYPGEDTRFYLNALAPNPLYQTIPAAHLAEYREGGTATAVTSSIQADVSGQTINGALTCPSVKSGLYVWRLTFGGLILTSNLIEVLTAPEARQQSIRLTYRNTRSLHGIRWPWLDPDFTQAVRVRANLIDSPYAVETALYREATTGYTRTYNTAQDKLLTFRTAYADATLLEGLAVALTHNTLRINSRLVTTREHLSLQYASRSHLAMGSFSVIDNSFANPLIP